MGSPKEWLPIGGELMLQRVVRRVATRAAIVVVSAAADQDLPPLPPEVEVVRDPIPDRGPLQGLAAGLGSLAGRVEWAFATASDAPMLATGWIDRLMARSEGFDLVLPRIDGRDHPLAALYRPGPASLAATGLLRADRLRLGAIGDVLRTRVVPAEELLDVDPGLQSLRNANDPIEYRAILDLIEGRDQFG